MLATKLTKKILEQSKAQELYEFSFKNQSKINSQNIKQTQTAFSLSKSIEHSNITTHKLETVQKSNLFDIDSAPREHPKTATNL